jgi:hypothetical protein
MPLSHEHVVSKILAKIKIYILTRAELLCPLCYEIPCIKNFLANSYFILQIDDVNSFKNSIILFGPNRTSERPSYLFSLSLVKLRGVNKNSSLEFF